MVRIQIVATVLEIETAFAIALIHAMSNIAMVLVVVTQMSVVIYWITENVFVLDVLILGTLFQIVTLDNLTLVVSLVSVLQM